MPSKEGTDHLYFNTGPFEPINMLNQKESQENSQGISKIIIKINEIEFANSHFILIVCEILK